MDLLRANQLYTEKKLGQNFLFNTKVIEKIVAAARIAPDDLVIEIGPGLGLLTRELLEGCGHVITVEKDPKLIPYLEKTFAGYPNLQIVHQDILTFEPPAAPYKVVANIPYYITSPIISHFLQRRDGRRPASLTILTQLEVAQKICAGQGEHSVLSLQTQLYCQPKIITRVAPGNFFPAPQVTSAVLQLDTLPEPRLSPEHEQIFLEIIKKGFSQKRKTLSNSLKGFHQLSKPDLENKLSACGLSPMIRPQELDFPQWEKLISVLEG